MQDQQLHDAGVIARAQWLARFREQQRLGRQSLGVARGVAPELTVELRRIRGAIENSSRFASGGRSARWINAVPFA